MSFKSKKSKIIVASLGEDIEESLIMSNPSNPSNTSLSSLSSLSSFSRGTASTSSSLSSLSSLSSISGINNSSTQYHEFDPSTSRMSEIHHPDHEFGYHRVSLGFFKDLIRGMKEMTLIEWMIIIMIIVLLSIILLPLFSPSSEILAHREYKKFREELIPFSDINNDGRITDEEIEQKFADMSSKSGLAFHDGDIYKDGRKISTEESLTYLKEHARKHVNQ